MLAKHEDVLSGKPILSHLELVQLPHVDDGHGPLLIRQVEAVHKCAVAMAVHLQPMTISEVRDSLLPSCYELSSSLTR